MADVYTRIGYIKGAQGAQGAPGEKGDTGDAATIQVGSVTTVPYGQTANVVNSGTEQAAVFDFTIPQGRPGQQVTDMQDLTLGSITTSAAEFPLPAVGETGKVLWGKVVKWFSDMSALVATKLNVANVVNNLTTTASGYALDARQGNVLSSTLNTTIADLSNTTRRVTRMDSTGTGIAGFYAFCDSITGGTMQYFRMRSSTPTSAENYSAGIIMRMTQDDTVVFMISRSTGHILTLKKVGGTWDTGWYDIG